MATLSELIEQREQLEKLIQKARSDKKKEAIEKVRAIIAEVGLTPEDIFKGALPQKPFGPSKVAAKYVDKSTGNSWSGRGLKPTWLRTALESGRKIEEFAV